MKNEYKYNIFILLNDGYIKLGKIFMNSLFKNTNINNINNIFVGNIGLSEENKKFIKSYEKVIIIDTDKYIKFDGVQTKSWFNAVSMKTKILLELVEKNNFPLIMIDSDCLILKDFDHKIDLNYDIQVCKRERICKGFNDMKLKYIASFLIINNKNSVEFIKNWIENINKMYESTKLNKSNRCLALETPSMCMMIDKYKDSLKINELDEREISSCCKYSGEKTLIIHMKSPYGTTNTDHEHNFNKRISNVKNFDKNKILSYLK